jgi:hypothetical protein
LLGVTQGAEKRKCQDGVACLHCCLSFSD